MRLRAVPDQPRKAIGYVRVSAVMGRGEDLMSPQIQAAAIRDHCERNNLELTGILEDTDLTGRLWKSRQIEDAVAQIEAGQVAAVVVWKWSRVARNRRDWAVAVDRVEAAGGSMESATEPFDASSAGRFARGVLAELAAFESDRIGEGWKDVFAQRHANGLPANGRIPWGWAKRGRLIVPHPERAPIVTDLYARYLGGTGFGGLAQHLDKLGQRPARSTYWAATTVKHVLDSPFHAGFVELNGDVRRGAHEPIIDLGTWEKYQAVRRDNRREGRKQASVYLLAGLVRCSCGANMTGAKASSAPQYRCPAGMRSKAHPGGYVSARIVETAVLVWLEQVAGCIDAAIDAAPLDPVVVADRTLVEAQIVDIDRKLARLTEGYLSGVITEPAYRATQGALGTRRAGLVVTLTELSDRQAIAAQRPAQDASDLLGEWDTLPVVARRAALRTMIDHVEVTPGAPRTIKVYPI